MYKKENKIICGSVRKNLPKYGWIQSCYYCDTPTSRVRIRIFKERKYKVFVCYLCYQPRRYKFLY